MDGPESDVWEERSTAMSVDGSMPPVAPDASETASVRPFAAVPNSTGLSTGSLSAMDLTSLVHHMASSAKSPSPPSILHDPPESKPILAHTSESSTGGSPASRTMSASPVNGDPDLLEEGDKIESSDSTYIDMTSKKSRSSRGKPSFWQISRTILTCVRLQLGRLP